MSSFLVHELASLLWSSYILCPPEDDVSNPLVHKAGLPVRLPPGINIDDLAALQPLPDKVAMTESQPLPQSSTDHNSDSLHKKAFDMPMLSDPTSTHLTTDLDADPLLDQPLRTTATSYQASPHSADQDANPLPHDLEDEEDDDVLVELSHVEECPLSIHPKTLLRIQVNLMTWPLLVLFLRSLENKELHTSQWLLIKFWAAGLGMSWSEERTDMLQKTTFTFEREQYCILLSEIHKSLCLSNGEGFVQRYHRTFWHLRWWLLDCRTS